VTGDAAMTIHDLTLGLLLGLPWALVGVIILGSATAAAASHEGGH
jgi:hypothetical protein